MPKQSDEKILLVEGKNDAFAFAGLMNYFVNVDPDVVYHKDLGNVDPLLDAGTIGAHLKERNIKMLGIVVDANGCFNGRWQQLHTVLCNHYGSVPEQIPSSGLILQEPGMPVIGVWIMPDNQSNGMFESFLKPLVPKKDLLFWEYAQQVVVEAKKRGADFKDVHQDKAEIHTWLAWKDEPGEPLGTALKNSFNTKSDDARPFIRWYVELFDLSESLLHPID